MPRVKVPIPVEKAEVTAALPPEPVLPEPKKPRQDLPSTVVAEPREPLAIPSRTILMVGVGLVVLVLLIMVISLMGDRNHLKKELAGDTPTSTSKANTSAEIKQLTAQIGKVYQLPQGETPTLATVTDASKVRSQAFFKDSQNGDKVLLYSKAGQAILYRPSTKKIITVAPVNLNDSATSGGTTQ